MSRCDDYPFSTVVVTSPDGNSARAALSGPLAALRSSLPPSVRIHSISDPYDARTGSGGGTIAALDHADAEGCSGSVLIVHAGGESSRCPTQMSLGKAWTSLPVHHHSDETTNRIDNPTSLLITTLGRLLHDLPSGSVVVAASDVLLSLPSHTSTDSLPFARAGEDAVIGLAVPAPLETATNHGVFCLEEKTNHDSLAPLMMPALKFLSKPTMSGMRSTPNGTFFVPDDEEEEFAWIDTGVVIFLPRAAAMLRTLARGVLSVCTTRGLTNLFHRHQNTTTTTTVILANESLHQFAKRTTLRVELYSHFMLALVTTDKKDDKLNEYLSIHKDLERSILQEIHNVMSRFHLRVYVVPAGKFIHLGTTAELMDFMIHGVTHAPIAENLCNKSNSSSSSYDANTMDNKNTWKDQQNHGRRMCRDFGRRVGLTKRSHTFLSGIDVHDSSVVLNSILQQGSYTSFQPTCLLPESGRKLDPPLTPVDVTSDPPPRSVIGAGTIIEHVCVTTVPHLGATIEIGPNCLISGLRGNCTDKVIIPAGMCLQTLPLKLNWMDEASSATRASVLEYVKTTTITQDSSGVTPTDLDDDCSEQKKLDTPCPARELGLSTYTSQDFVYIYLGVQDSIKARATIYGIDIDKILRVTGLSTKDLWDECIPMDEHTLWNAKIHPVVQQKQGEGQSEINWHPFSWITTLVHNLQDKECEDLLPNDAMDSLDMWRALPRLSLSEIRSVADAYAEFRYRTQLTESMVPDAVDHRLQEIHQIVLNRKHEPCNFDFVVDDFIVGRVTGCLRRALATVDDIICIGLRRGQIDVSCRGFMLMSLLFFDLANAMKKNESDNDVAPPNLTNTEAVLVTEIDKLRSRTASIGDRVDACEAMFALRTSVLAQQAHPLTSFIRMCSLQLENAAFALTELCVCGQSLNFAAKRLLSAPPLGAWIVATAPARIDLSGGWSDTPPISYEFGGAVACLAVTVDGRKPLSARCRKIRNESGIVLRTESRESATGSLVSASEVKLLTVGDLADFRDPHACSALLKCALICLGLVSLDDLKHHSDKSLQPFLNAFCDCKDEYIGLEIVSTSLLPCGSGMGSSSILGGCVLAAIAKCVGMDILGASDDESCLKEDDRMIQAVLFLEQLLSTGGGWQDQVGGLVGGLKLGLSDVHVLPLCTKVVKVPLRPDVRNELNARLLLAFTGQPRLAKNILQTVLRRWARRTSDIVKSVNELVRGAHETIDELQRGNIDSVGLHMTSYWNQKKVMAGEASGVETALVKSVLSELLERDEICGGTLCGAGGGGFLALLARKGRNGADIRRVLKERLDPVHNSRLSWHDCSICEEGLTLRVANDSSVFDIAWH